MKTFTNIDNFQSSSKTIVTIGTFDGVHLGHKQIIEKLKNSTKNFNYQSVLISFFPHPRMVLNSDSSIKLLNTISEKSDLLQKTGLQNLIIHPFDKVFSELSAEVFVTNILVQKLNIHKIIIGHDHQFGKNRAANIHDLIQFGEKYNFLVEQISAKEINQVAVSSSKIRNALLNGNIKLANQFLGYSYFFSGKVIKGNQLGRTIGFPTANINIQEDYKLIPKNGVYIVKSFLYQKWIYGMMNIGLKPTIGNFERSIEVHFLDFSSDLYNQEIQVFILDFIRDEQKFESINGLISQLNKDKSTTIDFILKYL